MAEELQNARRLQFLANLPRATVAVVRGRCAGLGLTLAMLCDFVVCSEDAVFSDPSVREGGVPSFALWPFFAWHKISKQLLFGGEFSGVEAERLGLISKAVPATGSTPRCSHTWICCCSLRPTPWPGTRR